MTRPGQRPSPGSPRRRWPGAIAATSLLLTVVVWVADGSEAQTELPFDVDVSKITDLVNGETIEINVRTDPGTTINPGAESEVRTCRSQVADYTPAQFDNVGGDMCVVNRAPLSEFDESVDNDFLHRFPDNGPEAGRRAIAILRPGQGTAHWQQGGEHELTCDQEHPCQLVFRLHLQTGTGAPQTVIHSGSELVLGFRPETGVAGCTGPAAGAIESGMPDRLQDAWLDWTRSACQASGGEAPTNAFFQTEGEALSSFAGGSRDLAYSGVSYRDGFDPPTRRSMVATPVALNAVVLAVGGGYTVQDGTWPSTLPRPADQFRLTNAELATLLGQLQSIYVTQYAADVLARNPFVPSELDLSNFNAGSAPLAVTGAQSTSLFATTYLDTLAPAQWKDPHGVARGVEVDLNNAVPTHGEGGLDLKTGRPDLARIVYRNLYLQGTYYVLTDLATASALGLTPVSLQNAAGQWVTPTAETMAAAVPTMDEQADGTLVPDVRSTTGYPLTFVEYAMAPAQPLVTDRCQPRAASQQLLDDWLEYVTTDGQSQLAANGLVPLTPSLAQEAIRQRARVGAQPAICIVTPPTTDPPGGTTSTTTPPASVTDPGGVFDPDDDTPGSGNGTGNDDDDLDGLTGNGGARPSRESTPDTRQEAARAAQEAEIELPDLQGIRAINTLGPPLALLVIGVLSTVVALSTAGYPAPAALARFPGRARRGVGAAGAVLAGLARRGARRAPPPATGETAS